MGGGGGGGGGGGEYPGFHNFVYKYKCMVVVLLVVVSAIERL